MFVFRFKTLTCALALCGSVLVAPAQAATITVSVLDAVDFNSSFGTRRTVGEDFEALGAAGGKRFARIRPGAARLFAVSH